VSTGAAPCPCGTGRLYEACCGPLHEGAPAVSAEALMRSRYSAYARALEGYLLATWSPATRPASLGFASTPQPRWLGLKVMDAATQDATHATVEFVARYRAGGREQRLHEVSRFELSDERWYYVDGDIGK
jgi:SEC-C motif-containing protein